MTEAPQSRPEPVRIGRGPEDLGDAVEIGVREMEIPAQTAVGGAIEPFFGGCEQVVFIPRVHRQREELLGHDLFGLGEEPGFAAVIGSQKPDSGHEEAPEPALATADVDHVRV